MYKQDFLEMLRKGLSGLPQSEIEERLAFYTEMIEDRMEDGLSEAEAVAAVGTVEEIVAQTVSEIPLAKLAKERIMPKRRLRAWEILLLALGSPVWLSLLISAAAVVLSVYVSLWSVIVSLWAGFVSLAVSSVACVVAVVILAVSGHGTAAVAVLAATLVCMGLSIFIFFGCKAATKGILLLTKRFALWIKNRFVKKEEA